MYVKKVRHQTACWNSLCPVESSADFNDYLLLFCCSPLFVCFDLSFIHWFDELVPSFVCTCWSLNLFPFVLTRSIVALHKNIQQHAWHAGTTSKKLSCSRFCFHIQDVSVFACCGFGGLAGYKTERFGLRIYILVLLLIWGPRIRQRQVGQRQVFYL